MSAKPTLKTPRTTVRRLKERGAYDREALYRILDEGLVCHAGFAVDGRAFVLPMAYARQGDRLILHGSVASRLMTTLAEGAETCVTVTLLDGLVLARSVFHHSMNYRSAVVFGVAARDPRPRREAGGAGGAHRAPGPRTIRGCARTVAEGACRHRGAGAADRRGLGEGA